MCGSLSLAGFSVVIGPDCVNDGQVAEPGELLNGFILA